MKKIVFIIPLLLLLISCKGKIDLEKIAFDSKIDEKFRNYEKEVTNESGFKSYTSTELNDLKFGEIDFNTYKVKNGYPYGENQIWILVDDYDNNTFSGIELILNNEKGSELFNYINKKYGKADSREDSNSKAYFWNAKNIWVFLKQKHEFNMKHEVYTQTTFSFIKKGIRVENSKDEKVFTILDYFNLTYPK